MEEEEEEGRVREGSGNAPRRARRMDHLVL